MTREIHPDFQKIAIEASQSLGLRLSGVDIITRNISKSLEENEGKYVILELNGAP